MSKKKSREGLTVKVKTARGRRSSSTRWLQRQLNDPFVDKAKKEGYRSRAVYKLQEIDNKFTVLKKAKIIVDLGCAPGGWLQLAKERSDGRIIGIDLQDVEPVDRTEIIKGDIRDDEVLEEFIDLKIDVVMSDMAASSCGHKETDHLRIISLCEIALDFAVKTLKPGGSFICKILQGGGNNQLVEELKSNFNNVKYFKPKASRQDSSEAYVVALDFKGP